MPQSSRQVVAKADTGRHSSEKLAGRWSVPLESLRKRISYLEFPFWFPRSSLDRLLDCIKIIYFSNSGNSREQRILGKKI